MDILFTHTVSNLFYTVYITRSGPELDFLVTDSYMGERPLTHLQMAFLLSKVVGERTLHSVGGDEAWMQLCTVDMLPFGKTHIHTHIPCFTYEFELRTTQS